MRNNILSVSALAAAAMCSTVLAETPVWGAWNSRTVPVGNERDGFHDAVEARAVLSNPDACNGLVSLPYLVRIPEEKKLLMLVACGNPSKARLMESRDDGETWSAPAAIGGIDDISSSWGLTYCGNGVLLIADGYLRSTDGGKTWKWAENAFKNNPRFGEVVAGWDPWFVFPGSNGRHLLCGVHFSRNFHDPEAKVVTLLRESFDAGETWQHERGVPEWPGVSESHIIANAQGELVAALRASTLMSPVNDQSDRLESSISADGGKTWTNPRVVAGNGRHHPSMALLPDGRIVMSYVVRNGYPDTDGKYTYGIEAVISHDGGHTWDTDHRYLLDRWSNDCRVTDEQGRTVDMERYWAAPQCTSTVYLPESDTLLTAYGTFRVNRKIGGVVLPRQTGLIKWKPLAKYSEKKNPPAAPLPAAEALRRVRANGYWPVNYNAANGLPDCGWINRYPRGAVSLQPNGWLRIDERGTLGAMFSIRGVDYLETITGTVGLRALLNIPELDDPGKPNRFLAYAAVGTGHDKFTVFLFVDEKAQISGGTFGKVAIDTKCGIPFLLEACFDPASRTARLWVDGKLAAEKEFMTEKVAPELPASFYFGHGSGSIGGLLMLKYLQFGEIK